MPRGRPRKTPSPTLPFVVYVAFPSGQKEYAYLCSDPSIRQGSWVVANGTEVQVRRTASHDPIATRYIMTNAQAAAAWRRKAIREQLARIETALLERDRFATLAKRSPEARRLLKELESL